MVLTIRSTITNKGTIRLWDLELSSDIKKYTPDIINFFAAHNVLIEGGDKEVRFIGQENSLVFTPSEVNNFVKQQKIKEEHLRLVTLYNASLPSINAASIELCKLRVSRELRLLINSFVATKPSPLKM